MNRQTAVHTSTFMSIYMFQCFSVWNEFLVSHYFSLFFNIFFVFIHSTDYGEQLASAENNNGRRWHGRQDLSFNHLHTERISTWVRAHGVRQSRMQHNGRPQGVRADAMGHGRYSSRSRCNTLQLFIYVGRYFIGARVWMSAYMRASKLAYFEENTSVSCSYIFKCINLCVRWWWVMHWAGDRSPCNQPVSWPCRMFRCSSAAHR